MINNYKDVIYSGHTVPNYKKMCELLGEEVTDGNSRKAQLKEWHRYFDYEKTGQKFEILYVYDKPLDKDDKRRKGNNSLYVKSIELILTDLLSKLNGYQCKLTKLKLYEALSITNSEYQKYKSKEGYKAIESWSPDLTPFDVRHFYRETDHVLDKILFSALKSMQNRRVIEWERQYNIVEKSANGSEVRRVATSDEVHDIVASENRALKKMGLDKRSQVFQKFLSEKYYGYVNDDLKELYGWEYVYIDYYIIYVQDCMERANQVIRSEIEEIKQIYKIDINDERQKLNGQIFDAYDKHTSKQFYDNQDKYKKHENSLMRVGFGNESKPEPFRYKFNHLEIQDYLSRCLIKL